MKDGAIMYSNNRTLVEIHTADIHFGAMDPKTQSDILMDQMINEISKICMVNGEINVY